MGLNIKNDETCLLSLDLARLAGETMAGTITVALRERLERVVERFGLEKSCLGPDPPCTRPWHDGMQSLAARYGHLPDVSLSRPFRYLLVIAQLGSLCEGSFEVRVEICDHWQDTGQAGRSLECEPLSNQGA